jgi:gliding motility-associated lipoprotein GldD
MRKAFVIGIVITAISAFSLWKMLGSPEVPVPKPKGYFRIHLPEPSYRNFEGACPFSLPVSEFATVELLDDKTSGDSCRFNIFYPKLKARIHCTFLPVSGNIHELARDAYGFAAKHEMKASAIERFWIEDPSRDMFGVQYNIEGGAASPVQFFLTDSTQHFFRGALYFDFAPNPDSIAPVLQYIKRDIQKITDEMSWR